MTDEIKLVDMEPETKAETNNEELLSLIVELLPEAKQEEFKDGTITPREVEMAAILHIRNLLSHQEKFQATLKVMAKTASDGYNRGIRDGIDTLMVEAASRVLKERYDTKLKRIERRAAEKLKAEEGIDPAIVDAVSPQKVEVPTFKRKRFKGKRKR